MKRALHAAVALLLLPGCYSYAAVEPAMLHPGDEVKLHLDREGMIDLPELPRQSGPLVSGRLLASDPAQLRLLVPIALQSDGVSTRSLRQEVPIARPRVVQMERRELSRLRTGLAVVGGVLGAAAIITGFGGIGTPSPEEPAEPVDEEAGVGVLTRLVGWSISIR